MTLILSGSDGVSDIDGSASTPAVRGSDANTGIYFPAADNIGFATGGTIRGRWTDDGLCFGSDTAAASALDDYEEGTFTGTLTGGTTAPTNPVTATGTYTKIGRLVSLSINFINLNITGATGKVKVTGLPFTSSSSNITLGSMVNNRGPNAPSTAYLPASDTALFQGNYEAGTVDWATVGANTFAYFTISYQT